MGCTTNNFMVSDEVAGLCNNCKSIKKAEAVPVEPTSTPTPVPKQSNNLPPQMLQQGWRQSTKRVLCAPPAQILRSVKNYGERPYMYWEDPNLKTSIMLFRSKERDSLTLVENVNPQMACIITNGVQIHIEEDTFKKGKLREASKEKGPHLLEINTKED